MRTETKPRHVASGLVSAVILVAVATLLVHPSTAQAGATSGTRTISHRVSDDADPVGADLTGRSEAPLPQRPGRTRPVVLLYGDSLAWESQAYFVWESRRLRAPT